MISAMGTPLKQQGLRILLVEDDEAARTEMRRLLGVYNVVVAVDSLASMQGELEKASFDVLILDRRLPDGDAVDLIADVKSAHPETVVILLTGVDADSSDVRRFLDAGAAYYIRKSINAVPDLLLTIPLAIAKRDEELRSERLEAALEHSMRYEIIGSSTPTMMLRETILSLKGSISTVLITGESGTGKELVARRIHSLDRRGKPFIAINCSAIPETLFESELFGHKRGAFTGATEDKKGVFELAADGTIFLDEIGEMPLTMQAKLLRVLQENEFHRVGDPRTFITHARVIAATNQELETMVAEKKFREDLYYRLSVYPIETTPLRERKSDIAELARFFALTLAGPHVELTDPALKLLETHSWPGNIRELRNCIERASISMRSRGTHTIGREDILFNGLLSTATQMKKGESAGFRLPARKEDVTDEALKIALNEAERKFLEKALELCGGSAEALGECMGWARSKVFRILKLHELTKKYKSHRSGGGLKDAG